MRRAPLFLLIPVLAAVFAFAGALDNGWTNWDDPLYLLANPLTENPLAHGLGGLILTDTISYPIPVTILGYAAQRAVFGLDPSAFHAMSLALHLLCVVLAAGLARRLGASWLGASLAAALFAVHPVVVEPVAWVVGQKDLWAAAFLLWALIVRAGERGQGRRHSVAVVVLVSLSLLSKPSTVGAALMIAGVDLLCGRRLRDRSNLILYGTLLALGVAASLLALAGHGGAPADNFSTSSMAEAIWALGLNVRHLLWPDPLLARYFSPDGAAFTAGVVIGLAALGIWIEAIIYSYRRGAKHIAVALALAGLAYAPVSGILPVTRGTADSYLYLPLALAVIALARGIDWLDRRRRVTAVAPTAILVVVLTIASAAQTDHWESAVALWTPVADHHPDEPRAVSRVGDGYLFAGRPKAALAVYEQVSRRFPEFAAGHVGRGAALSLLGQLVAAEAAFARGAGLSDADIYAEEYGWFLVRNSIEPTRPDLAPRALRTVGALLAERGKRLGTLARTAQLLEQFGEPALAARVRARIEVVRSRESP